MPYASYQLNNGDTIYKWRSNAGAVSMPQVTNLSGSSYGGHYSGTAVTSGGGAIGLFCELQIRASPNGSIVDIQLLEDSIGWWTTSCFYEKFASERKSKAK
jgi:hypothetical protein